ncbi:MAG TPA: D-aminoacylase [Candidatus Cybelea sp.]|nr:D-aminoacylase [Candidatus Cybelea sp.]
MHDLVLRGGLVLDGSGAPGIAGDVAIDGDRIAAIGAPGALAGSQTIDAAGLAVAPGFIDVHTHDDRLVLADPAMAPKISQGVTTVVVGNCGISLAPMDWRGEDPIPPFNLLGGGADFRFPRMRGYVAAVEAAQPAVNVAVLVGHSTLRVQAMGDLQRSATPTETAHMRALLAEALEAGAVGLSSGLFYPPARAADPEEVVPLASDVAKAGGVYTTHMRDEDDGVLDSLAESFAVGRKAALPVVISHHKCNGRRNWGRSAETLGAIERAAARQPVGADAYPYAASSTVLDADHIDADLRTLVTWSDPHPEMAGRDLADIARQWGVSQREAALRLDPAGAVYFHMHEDDVRKILAHPLVMIGSDGLPHDKHPHPRLWGTFPRVLGHYAREVGLFPLAEAVRKMTALPAERFKLQGRGRIAAGAYADLVLFDPATVRDAASFEHPIAPARGIETVLVNGAVAWRAGEGAARKGRFLKRA